MYLLNYRELIDFVTFKKLQSSLVDDFVSKLLFLPTSLVIGKSNAYPFY